MCMRYHAPAAAYHLITWKFLVVASQGSPDFCPGRARLPQLSFSWLLRIRACTDCFCGVGDARQGLTLCPPSHASQYLINVSASCRYEGGSCWEDLGKAAILLLTYIISSFTQKQWTLETKLCKLLEDCSLNSQFRASSWTRLTPYEQIGAHLTEKVLVFSCDLSFSRNTSLVYIQKIHYYHSDSPLLILSIIRKPTQSSGIA